MGLAALGKPNAGAGGVKGELGLLPGGLTVLVVTQVLSSPWAFTATAMA